MVSRTGSASSPAETNCQQYEFVPGVLKGIEEWQREQRTSLFDCLYKLFFKPVLAYILHHGGTEEAAEDVFQDYSAELLQQIKEGHLSFAHYQGPFGAIVMQGAKFIWLRQFRKKEFRVTSIGLPEESRGLASDLDLTEFLQRQEDARALGKALDTLDAEHRIFVELFYQQGKSYQEIAVLTGKNASSMKANRHRIMEKLKTAFLSFL